VDIDLSNISDREIRSSFENILKIYLNPSFGSISKRDFEITLFIELQKLGIISENIYDIVSTLKIRRTKAQSLIYESKLRISDKNSLKEELQEIIKIQNIKNIEQDKIKLEIINPYLRDFIKNELRKLGSVSVIDTSFNSDILKFDVRDYLLLLCEYDENIKKRLETYLFSNKIIQITEKITKLPISLITDRKHIIKLVNFVTNLKQGVFNGKK